MYSRIIKESVTVNTGTQTISRATFSVSKYLTKRGSKGATGNNDSIIVQENGVNLTNTPHNILNFTFI